MRKIAIIGGGPAGLRAAEVAASGGASVTLFDAKPSVGRKFLVAGRGGLNLTRVESRQRLASHYSQPADLWPSLIADFDSDALRAWAAGLGVETFAASTGRVYPQGLKAAPLLRRWVQRLRDLGVHFAMNHRWTSLIPGTPLQLEFATPDGVARTVKTPELDRRKTVTHGIGVDPKVAQASSLWPDPSCATHRLEACATLPLAHFHSPGSGVLTVKADAAILALGGGSWPDTGSDGAWTAIMERLGVSIAPLQPANCGWELAWPASVLAQAEGQPIKNIVVRAGSMELAGELLVTRYGLEGGALYQLSPALRAMPTPELCIDFKPSFSVGQLVAKMEGAARARRTLPSEARQRWKLGDAAAAILESRGPFASAEAMAAEAKQCWLALTGPRPLSEAISSAGGVSWSELTAGLMLRRFPGVFVAGEMIDWEAPTGGYLIHGCFATATRAANAALECFH